jgi:hypothetical protein
MTPGALTVVASFLALFAEGKYIHSIIQGKTKPNFSGWFVFTASMTLVLASAYTLGARESLLLIGTFTVLHGAVALLSLKYGFVKFTRVEATLLVLALLGVVLWWFASNPWYTLLINVGIDLFGYLSIASKVYRHPGTEDTTAWLLSVIAYGLNLVAIQVWIPEEFLFSLSNVIMCSLILVLSLRRATWYP